MTASWVKAGPRRWPDAIFSLRADPRFCYSLYAPPNFREAPNDHALVVAIHGSSRDMEACKQGFVGFAQEHRCVVLAPLFPVGPLGDGNADGFKYLAEGDIRYDGVLLAMVAEVEEILARPFPTFMLFGFSGGGHFAHRFFYLHPERLSAVSVGAPGGVTRLDPARDWWLGTADVAARFGQTLDLAAIARVPAQLLVGAEDNEVFVYPKDWPGYIDGMDELGPTRIERNETLRQNWETHGVNVRREVVSGAAHEMEKMLPSVQAFFAEVLAGKTAAGAPRVLSQ